VCTAQSPDGPVTYHLTGSDDTFAVFPLMETDCVITNGTSTVTVTKHTLPAGAAQKFDFTLTHSGASPGGAAETPQLGDGDSVTYLYAPGSQVDISEAIPSGWMGDPEISCTANGNPVPGADGQSVAVTTVNNADVRCDFTNTEFGAITITKQYRGPGGVGGSFDFTGTWAGGNDFSIATPVGDGRGYTKTFTDVAPGHYSVTEPSGQQDSAGNATLLTELYCDIDSDGSGRTRTVAFTGRTADFDVTPGAVVDCYYANATPGRITVIKMSDPDNYSQDFGFQLGSTTNPASDTSFVLNPAPDDPGDPAAPLATWISPTLQDGTYDVTEDQPPGWTLSTVVCSLTDPNGAPLPDTSRRVTGGVSVDLPAGGNATCVFTNTAARATVTLTKKVVGVGTDYPWSFDFALAPTGAGGDAPTGGPQRTVHGTGANCDAPAVWAGLTPGQSYTLTEAAATGYQATVECDLPDADPAAGWQFTAPVDGRISCTAENTLTPITLYIAKRDSYQPLPGSGWELRLDDNGSMGAPVTGLTWTPAGPVGCEDCWWRVNGTNLLPGTYWLLETKAPGGFNLLAEPVQFTVAPGGLITLPGTDPLASAAPGEQGSAPAADGWWVLTVTDIPAFVLPATGGSAGVAPHHIALALVAIAAMVAIGAGAAPTRRRQT